MQIMNLLSGANVVVDGTTIGTVTDVDGNFTLDVPDGATLKISYIGYIEQTIPVGNKSVISVILKEDSQALDEVVVVGFGTQKKLNLTGAVTAVTGEEMSKRPVTNTATMLQGQVPGLRVNQGLGTPGMSLLLSVYVVRVLSQVQVPIRWF